MKFSNIQIFLVIILILLLFFILGGCKLRCDKGGQEGFYNQIRDQVSDPYYPDNCSHGMGCQLRNFHNTSGYAKAVPLTQRGKPCPSATYDIVQDTTCPECTTQVMRFY